MHLETFHPEGGTSPFIVQENYKNLAVKNVDSKEITGSHISETDDALYLKDAASNHESLQETKDGVECLEENQTEPNTVTANFINGMFPTNLIAPDKSNDEEQEEIVFKPRCLRNKRINHKNIHSNSVKTSETRSKPDPSSHGGSKRLGVSNTQARNFEIYCNDLLEI